MGVVIAKWSGRPGPVLVCCAAMLLLAAACARSVVEQGKPMPGEAVARIRAGETTEAEIREWFGPPADMVATESGKVFTYQLGKGSGGGLSIPFLGIGGGAASGQLLIVVLDREGKVVRHTFIGGP
jgi:hypothetical protein